MWFDHIDDVSKKDKARDPVTLPEDAVFVSHTTNDGLSLIEKSVFLKNIECATERRL